MAGADDMVEKAFDPKQQDVVARAIEQLSPDEAMYFLDKLERAIKKRKIQLTGYLVAMVVWLLGMVTALFVYGAATEGTFVGWVFVAPFGAVGLVLMLFGRWGDRVGRGILSEGVAEPGAGKGKGKGKGAGAAAKALPAAAAGTSPENIDSAEVVATPPADAKPAKTDDGG